MVERIQFGKPIEPPVLIEELPPLALLSKGRDGTNDLFQVYIVEDVYSQLWQHVRSSPMIECGGVLVGHPFKSIDDATTFVVIVAAIPQTSSNRGIAHFTVSTSEVANSREELEKKYPGLVAVGWYHSHPGHGVFLSAQDMTIVQSIYNLKWHLAIVLDPQRNEMGTFAGPNGEVVSNPIMLSKEPDSVRVIAKYNQLRKTQSPGDKNTHQSLLEEINTIVSGSLELLFWKKQGKYRDLILFSHSPMEEENQERLANLAMFEEKIKEVPVNKSTDDSPLILPRAARKENLTTISVMSLALIFLPAVVFCLLSIIVVVYFQMSIILILLGWGVFLSVLASYAVVYLISQGSTEKTIQFRKKNENYKFYGTFLLLSVVISWMTITIFSIALLK